MILTGLLSRLYDINRFVIKALIWNQQADFQLELFISRVLYDYLLVTVLTHITSFIYYKYYVCLSSYL